MEQRTNRVVVGSRVPGPAVRPEYLRLARDLAALTRCFGIALPAPLARDAATLAFTIECTDRLLDRMPDGKCRAAFGLAVLSSLRGTRFFNRNVTPELSEWLARLKEVAERHCVHAEFCKIVRALLDNSEQMRTTRDCDRFVGCAVREGRLMVELLLIILAKVSTTAFDDFMRHLAGPANLADKFRDAPRDYRVGELAIRPSLTFRARLLYETAWRTLRLVRHHAGNWRLARWGIQSLFIELVWFPFSRSHSH
jgi:hypothetical protein